MKKIIKLIIILLVLLLPSISFSYKHNGNHSKRLHFYQNLENYLGTGTINNYGPNPNCPNYDKLDRLLKMKGAENIIKNRLGYNNINELYPDYEEYLKNKYPNSYFNDDNNTDSLVDGNNYCNTQYGDYSIWTGLYRGNGQYLCTCADLYTWNENKTQCVKRPVNTQSDINCKSLYGEYAYGNGGYDKNGDYICNCQKGYDWNYEKTRCISTGNNTAGNRACHINYGENSYWSGNFDNDRNYKCNCKNGYTWNKDNTSCILKSLE